MSSGVAVNKKCIEAFTSIVKNREYRCIVLKINDEMTEVQVEKTHGPSEGEPKSEWDDFRKTLPKTDCRYIIYDFTFDYQGAQKNRLFFLLWSPEDSKVRSKMIYASSQEGVVNKLEGIQRQLQCTEDDELQYATIAKQLAAHTAGY